MSIIPAVIVPIVLVVVRREDRFLVMQEAQTDRGTWFLPAGRVDPGESLVEAAIRETREETRLDVRPVSLLWMEDWTEVNEEDVWLGRWRFVIRAEPVDPAQQPGPTNDALDARWLTLDEIAALPLRHPEVLAIFRAVQQGVPELPLDGGYLRHRLRGG